MEKVTAASPPPAARARGGTRWLNLVIAIGLLALTVWLGFQYNPAQRRLRADPSIMLYVGQQILRGNPPYRSVTIVKTPAAGILAAGALQAGRLIGWDDVFSARVGFIGLAGLLVAVTFLAGAALWSRWAGLYAAFMLLGMDILLQRAADGPSPKVPFILFGIASIWLGARQRWLLAGAAAALAFLTWQPGLIFVAAVALGAFLNAREQRWRAAGMTLLGALAPVALVGGYLALTGALDAGLRQSFGANASYFGSNKLGAGLLGVIGGNAASVASETPGCFTAEEWFLPLGILGLLGSFAAAVWQARRRAFASLFLLTPLALSFLVLAGFTLIDFQSCADVLPFFPYLALGGGWLGWQVVRLVTGSGTGGEAARRERMAAVVGAALGAMLLYYGLTDTLNARGGEGLAQQRELAATINRQLGPSDTFQQFGDAVFLVLLGRENATPFMHLGNKQGAGVLRAEGITPDELPQIVARAHPRVITLSRAKEQPWAEPLYTWIQANYTLTDSYDVTGGGTPQQTDLYVLK